MKFRTKPIVIEAWHWRPMANDWEAENMPMWLAMSHYYNIGPGNYLLIETLEGTMRADPDDWIIKGVKGEVYPCKPDIFEQTYEPVE